MSHTVKIESQIKDLDALEMACREVGAQFTRCTSVKLFASTPEKAVASVKLKGWNFPVAVKEDGTLAFDNYGGSWGRIERLNELKQQYGAAVVRRTMGAGWRIAQQSQPDGSLRMVLTR